eukprot:jgi/Mesvir1/24266/Mv10967-RA.1
MPAAAPQPSKVQEAVVRPPAKRVNFEEDGKLKPALKKQNTGTKTPAPSPPKAAGPSAAAPAATTASPAKAAGSSATPPAPKKSSNVKQARGSSRGSCQDCPGHAG